jgi:hypothetical protein
MFRLYDKVKLLAVLCALLASLALAACNQDSIFAGLDSAVPPTDPRIQGTPSKIVTADGKLYVANGKIFEYDAALGEGTKWKKLENAPEGYVADVASADNGVLYALTIKNTTATVWKKGEPKWKAISAATGYDFIQNIYGVGDKLFAGASKSTSAGGNDYAVLYEDPSDGFHKLVETESAILTGAGVINNEGTLTYYLGTLGKGIYMVTGSLGTLSASQLDTPSTIPTHIVGFLQLDDDTVIAASKNGNILRGTSAGFTVPASSLGGTFTGALALVDVDDPERKGEKASLLLIGVRGGNTSYKHGYRELLINADGTYGEGEKLRTPGDSQPSSIVNMKKKEGLGQYEQSLHKYPVTSLWVLQSDPTILFAGTPKNGLYSYRERSKVWQWNYEE